MFRVLVPDALKAEVAGFVEANDVPFKLVEDGEVDLRIEVPEERLESTPTTLYRGGYMNCPAALALAEKSGLRPQIVGALLNLLDIKVRHCSLGLFG